MRSHAEERYDHERFGVALQHLVRSSLSLRDGGDIDFCLSDPISQTLVGRVQHGLEGRGQLY